ncbi:MAG: TIM barrel protein, partial [Panacibacter sp.]
MQRRNFVKTLAVTAAGMGLAPQLFAAKKQRAIGVQLYTIRDAIAKDVTGSLERLSKLGYNEIELFGYNGTFFGKTPKEFALLCNGLGLKPVSSHYVSGRTTNSPATISNGWQKAIDDASELGLKYMVCAWLSPDERGGLDQYKKLAAACNKAGEACKKAGIQFCYHNHDFEFEKEDGKYKYDVLLNETDKDLVKMELDLYWVARAEQNAVELFNQHPGRFPLWHIKDMDNTPKHAFTEVGNGVIDFKTIFASANKA